MFELENLSYIKSIHPFEWVMLCIYCFVIFGITFGRQIVKIKTNPLYRYFGWGVLAKVISSVVFCLIYIYYYNGGDTVSYYETSRSLVNLGMKDLGNYVDVITSKPSLMGYLTFDRETGFPWPYMYFDEQTFFVAKLISPLVFVSFKSYLVTSILLSWISFFGAWKFFLLLCRYFPGLERRLAIGMLFIPSVLFWGSGILKDTITFSAVCWFIVGLDAAFMHSKRSYGGMAIMAVTLYILLSVKPYILYSLFPGAIIWVGSSRMKKIHSRFIRITLVPLVLLLSIGLGYGVLSLLGSQMGKFSINKMMETASVTQKDLKQDYYKGSSFDIGDFEPTFSGMLTKVPAAMAVGLFRPYVWEARNVVMVASGIENLVYLLTVFFLCFKLLANPRRFFRILGDYPILTFLLCYTLFFSVMVGLSTSNFGALVRFKIPFMSCYIALLLILHYFLSREGIAAEEAHIKSLRNNPLKYPQSSGRSPIY
ncbi:MAG TPA: hypothetical protein VK826_11675 [Bacteroidia bacterium]|nr:hypothetical protein [Bacteroidia bacterium]